MVRTGAHIVNHDVVTHPASALQSGATVDGRSDPLRDFRSLVDIGSGIAATHLARDGDNAGWSLKEGQRTT